MDSKVCLKTEGGQSDSKQSLSTQSIAQSCIKRHRRSGKLERTLSSSFRFLYSSSSLALSLLSQPGSWFSQILSHLSSWVRKTEKRSLLKWSKCRKQQLRSYFTWSPTTSEGWLVINVLPTETETKFLSLRSLCEIAKLCLLTCSSTASHSRSLPTLICSMCKLWFRLQTSCLSILWQA